MNIILIIVYWAVALLMAYAQYKTNLPMKNIVLENTLPAEEVNNPTVKRILISFLKWMLLSAIVFGLPLFSILIISYDSIVFLLFFISLFGNLCLQYVLTIKAIEEMHQLKLEKLWVTGSDKVVIDLKTMKVKNRKLFPVWLFIFPVAAFLLITGLALQLKGGFNSALFGQTFILCLGVFIVILLLDLWLYYLVAKMSVHALTKDSQVNQRVNDVQKSFYGRMLLSLMIFEVLMSAMMLMDTDGEETLSVSVPIFIVAAVVLLAAYILHLVFSYRRETNQLLSKVQPLYYENEDQYWRYGMYINPDDPRAFVPQRTSMQISFNLGHRAGKAVIAGIGVLLVLLVVGLTAFMGYNDFTPHPFEAKVQQSSRQLELKHAFISKKIALKDIRGIQLMENKVKNAHKINGTGTESYNTGTFSEDNQTMYLLIFRRTPKVIQIKTKTNYYYINDRTVKDTEEMFTRLKRQIQQGS